MRDYKLLLAAITLVLACIFIGVFLWLWISNGKNTDPLPIMVNENAYTQNDEDNQEALVNSILYVQAEDTLQTALDDLIIRFESRFPRVQVWVNYVPATALLSLNARQNESADNAPIDLIMAEAKLSQARLAPLQATLNNPQNKQNRSQINDIKLNNHQPEAMTTPTSQSTDNGNLEVRQLTAFSYATKHSETIDGVILTDNPIAATFRNYVLSSAGQDILNKYDYDTIDGYKNSMDDLFNPSSRAKKAEADNESVKIADAFNGN